MKFTMSIIDDQLPMVWLIGKYMLSMYDYFVGQLKEGTEDEKVFELSMELGLVWAPTVFHAFKGISYTEIVKNLWLKYYISITLLSDAYIQIIEFEIHPDIVRKDKLKELLKTTKNLVLASAKVNCIKTETYRLRVICFQLCNQIPKALKFYSKYIEFAKWYGAKLELSRTYFELGKFLSNPATKQNQLNGLSSKDYLEKSPHHVLRISAPPRAFTYYNTF